MRSLLDFILEGKPYLALFPNKSNEYRPKGQYRASLDFHVDIFSYRNTTYNSRGQKSVDNSDHIPPRHHMPPSP